MESNNVKIKKIISYVILGIYIIFMFLNSVITVILWIFWLFCIKDFEMSKDAVLPYTMQFIATDTLVLYGIPLILSIVQFWINKKYALVQICVILSYWVSTNFGILFLAF